jgi:hypothetical protein
MKRLLLLASLGLACGPSLADHPCPPEGTSLTYENFGRGFFEAHCTHCHGGAHGHSSRSFHSVELVRAQKERIFANATGENPPMPPGPDDPGIDERAKLAEWLACGAQ